MRHLSESEFVDLAEDALDARREGHVAACPSCRERAYALRAALRDASAVVVPEPSPLFWDHLSARVRESVAAGPAPERSAWGWSGTRVVVSMAAAAAVVVATVAGALMLRAGGDNRPALPRAVDHVVATDAKPRAIPDAENAEVWEVLTSAASTVGIDEARAAGMHVHPAAIDHAVQDLSAAELAELGRLLQRELKHSSN